MPQSGRRPQHQKQTSGPQFVMSAFDPKRTSGSKFAMSPNDPFETSVNRPAVAARAGNCGRQQQQGTDARRRMHTAQSGLMLAARMTLPHFSLSAAMSSPKSAGDPGRSSPPCSASFAFIVGSASAALISLLSLSTISAGVALGAPTPNQMLAS